MALSAEDRALIEAVPLCGPKTADYLGLAGVTRFDDLADLVSHFFRFRFKNLFVVCY
jgi:hypothetical protein